MKSLLLSCAVLCVFVACGAGVSDDLLVLRDRLAALEATGSAADALQFTRFAADTARIRELVAAQRPDGSWPDVDYAADGGSVWSPSRHLSDHALYLARAAFASGDASLRAAVVKALDRWAANPPQCANWWWNEIGAPQDFALAALLVDAALDDAHRARYADYLKVSKIGMTGQNRVWLSRIVLMRAVLTRDEALADEAVSAIHDEVRLQEKEGIMDDWSYRLHGRQMQFGNYGASFILNMSRLANAFAGTRWAFPREKLDLLGNLEEQGFRWTLFKGRMDVSALGRQLAPGVQRRKASAVTAALGEFAGTGWKFPSEPPSGFRYFPKSAYAVWRDRDRWMASVKMHTHDILETETWVNGENTFGGHLADGALFVYADGSEYEDVFPLWGNWRLLPGVTTYRDLPPVDRGGYVDWPGANEVSDIIASEEGDGAALDFTLKRDGLEVRKHWRFAPRRIDCSGEILSATNGASRVVTCVEHARAAANAEVLGYADGCLRVRNGAFLYEVFAPEDSLRAVIETRKGSWKGICPAVADREDTGRVLLIEIDHGFSPAAATYRYRVSIFQ